MLKKLIIITLLSLTVNQAFSQKKDVQIEPFYINLFISADKTIFVENSKTTFQKIATKVADIAINKPFILDQRIIYRIFAYENLDLGYIMDVNQEMISGYAEDISTQRFLINTMKLNIDGQNWFDAIDMKDLKKID